VEIARKFSLRQDDNQSTRLYFHHVISLRGSQRGGNSKFKIHAEVRVKLAERHDPEIPCGPYPYLGETQTSGDAGRPLPHPRGICEGYRQGIFHPFPLSLPLPNQMPQCKRAIVLTVVTSLDGRAACTMEHTCIIARVSRRSPSLSFSLVSFPIDGGPFPFHVCTSAAPLVARDPCRPLRPSPRHRRLSPLFPHGPPLLSDDTTNKRDLSPVAAQDTATRPSTHARTHARASSRRVRKAAISRYSLWKKKKAAERRRKNRERQERRETLIQETERKKDRKKGMKRDC